MALRAEAQGAAELKSQAQKPDRGAIAVFSPLVTSRNLACGAPMRDAAPRRVAVALLQHHRELSAAGGPAAATRSV